jgi:putative transcriptional regulator
MTCHARHTNCEGLLLEYAAGTLDDAHTLIVAAYLTISPAGRRYVQECENLGGALVEHLCDPVDVSAGCLEGLLEKITRDDSARNDERPCCNQTCIDCDEPLPAPLANILPPGMAETLKWKTAFGGMQWIDIPVGACHHRVQLIRCAPGFKTPRHRHRGSEVTLVLEGAFDDETGHYSRGDIVIMDCETRHEPVADPETGCLCFSVTAAPVFFTGFLTRLLNPFV